MKADNFFDKFGNQVAEYRFNPTPINRIKVINLCKAALIRLGEK